MRLPVFSLFLATSLFATASVAESICLQGGALTILGWAIWYLLTKAIPHERAAFLEAQKKERRDFLEAQGVTRKAFQESLSTLAKSLDRLASAMSGDPN